MEIKCISFMSTIRSVNIGSMFFMLLLAVLQSCCWMLSEQNECEIMYVLGLIMYELQQRNWEMEMHLKT